MQFRRLLFAFHFFLGVRGSTWPVPYDLTSETMPNLELSLSPPSQPAPEVAAVVRDLESARERTEAAHMDEMQTIVKQEVQRVQSQAAEIVGRAMRTFADSAQVKLRSNRYSVGERQLASFLAGRSEYSSTDHVVVKVTAVPGRMPDSALNKEVDAIGKRQIDALERMFKQATVDLKGLADVLLNEFQGEVQKHFDMLVAHDVPHTLRGTRQSDQPHHHAVFVEAGRSRSAVRVLPGQANVQLVAASSSSPALSSAVQNMAGRASVAERLGRSKLLAIEMQLLKAAHRVMKATLQAAVGRLVEASGARVEVKTVVP